MEYLTQEALNKIASGEYVKDENQRQHYVELIKTLDPYLSAFGDNSLTVGGLVVYARALGDLSPKELDNTMTELIQTSSSFPRVSEILRQAEKKERISSKDKVPAPDEAWHEVQQQVKLKGMYTAWDYSCEAVSLAVKNFGKTELCTTSANQVNETRAQFMKIYADIVDRIDNQKAAAKTETSVTEEKRPYKKPTEQDIERVRKMIADWRHKMEEEMRLETKQKEEAIRKKFNEMLERAKVIRKVEPMMPVADKMSEIKKREDVIARFNVPERNNETDETKFLRFMHKHYSTNPKGDGYVVLAAEDACKSGILKDKVKSLIEKFAPQMLLPRKGSQVSFSAKVMATGNVRRAEPQGFHR